MTHKEMALAYFGEKAYCSRSVLGAYAQELGLTEKQAFKIAYCFNAGMRKGQVCGACSGALMVLGMMFGQYDKNDLESRMRANEMTDRSFDRFKKLNGTYICNQILGCDISTPEGAEYARSHGLFVTTCRDMVALAVQVLEEILDTSSPPENGGAG
ncbi:MAG: C_GCAxxG_C_C family protein [Ruminococcus sp.]|nr:C_GCAxxG_C_C family protein [Ruminococcus sp.]